MISRATEMRHQGIFQCGRKKDEGMCDWLPCTQQHTVTLGELVGDRDNPTCLPSRDSRPLPGRAEGGPEWALWPQSCPILKGQSSWRLKEAQGPGRAVQPGHQPQALHPGPGKAACPGSSAESLGGLHYGHRWKTEGDLGPQHWTLTQL